MVGPVEYSIIIEGYVISTLLEMGLFKAIVKLLVKLADIIVFVGENPNPVKAPGVDTVEVNTGHTKDVAEPNLIYRLYGPYDCVDGGFLISFTVKEKLVEDTMLDGKAVPKVSISAVEKE